MSGRQPLRARHRGLTARPDRSRPRLRRRRGRGRVPRGDVSRREGDRPTCSPRASSTVEKEILGLEGVAVHVKGMEPAGYDPRTLKGMGLTFIDDLARRLPPARDLLQGRAGRPQRPAAPSRARREVYVDWERPSLHHGHADLLPLLSRPACSGPTSPRSSTRPSAPTTPTEELRRDRQPHHHRDARLQRASAASPPRPRSACRRGSRIGRPKTSRR